MMTKRSSSPHFSPRLITEKVYRLVKRGKDQVQCYNCKRVLKIGDSYFVSSQHKIYCSECWLSLHHDITLEDFPYTWKWNESKQVWELILTKEEGGSHVEEGQTE